MDKKKILYISYDGLTDPLGQSQILPYLEGLSKKGFLFTILSFEKKNRYEKEKDIVKAIMDVAGIKWIPLRFTAKPPVFSKIYDRLRLRKTAFELYRKEKFDVIHCRSYVAAEAGLMLKKKFGAKFLFDMRGFWADEKLDNGQWNKDLFFYRIVYKHYKKKEKEFLLNADAIVSLTQAAKNYLLSIAEYKNLSIIVIPCCADFEHFDYHEISSEDVDILKHDLKIPPTAKIITYLGSIGGWYLTNEMFSFFKILMDQKPEYVMLILTKDDSQKIKTEASRSGIPDQKIFITYSARESLPRFLAASTCSIFFIKDTFSKMASSPTKHAELMGMGIPVICNDIGDTGHIVNSTKTGIVINDLGKESFLNNIREINNLEKMDREHIRNKAIENFDLKRGVEKYFGVYNKILNKR